MKRFKLKQSRDEIKSNPAQVGAAVQAILAKDMPMQTVEETTDAMTKKYIEELVDCARLNMDKFPSTFYIVVLRKKEFWALNVLRQWYVARGTKPSAKVLREDYPNHDHDIYEVNPVTQEIKHLWSLPTAQDALTIMKNKAMYDPQTVCMIQMFNEGKLA